MYAIEIQDLSKTFTGKRGTVVEALKGLSLNIESGEVFGFLGPNGAGKSTAIKIIMGLVRATKGQVQLAGFRSDLPAARKTVGYLPENPAFYDFLSAEEYVSFVARSFGNISSAKVEEVLRLLELWDARKRPIRTYSKGMVQRVGLAQVLVHDPDIYILDEPMSGLDPLGRALVKKIILNLKQRGKCVFFSSHIIADMESVCDRVGIIYRGELKAVKEVEKIVSEGISSYQVRYFDSVMRQHDVSVVKSDLTTFLAGLESSGCQIQLIEPVRKTLEEFFLDIVSC